MLERLKSVQAGVGARREALQARWPWLRVIVQVQKRFDEVHGGYLASAVTLAAFLSLFPLMLVAIAVLGFFARNTADLPGELVSWFGLPSSGETAEAITEAIETAEKSRRTASIVGFVGLLWAGLGLVGALSYVYDSVWQVKGRGWKDRLLSLAWLVGAAVLFLASIVVTAVIAFLPGWLRPINILAGMAVSTALFLWSAKVLGNRQVGWRPLLPGAILAAVGLEVMKVVGAVYVPEAVSRSSALYGSLGVVFALLAWLFFFGRLIVYSSALNVVLWERREGTVTIELQVPKLPGHDPVDATRSGKSNDPPPDAEEAAQAADAEAAADTAPAGAAPAESAAGGSAAHAASVVDLRDGDGERTARRGDDASEPRVVTTP